MDLIHLTQVVKYEITKKGFIFYDEKGNIPDPSVAYWDGTLSLYDYKGKTLEGLPGIVDGGLDLSSYNGESLEGLSKIVNGYLWLNSYNGNAFNNLPKEYEEIFINNKKYTKSEFDDFLKTEKLKSILLD